MRDMPVRLENIFFARGLNASRPLEIHDQVPCIVMASYSDGQTFAMHKSLVYFSFEPQGICTADESGVITAVKGGSTTITAHYGEFTASVKVEVNPARPVGITLKENPLELTTYFGVPQKFELMYRMSDGTTEPIETESVELIAEGKSTVEISPSGRYVTGVEHGTTRAALTVGEFSLNVVFNVPQYPTDILFNFRNIEAMRAGFIYDPGVYVIQSGGGTVTLAPHEYEITSDEYSVKPLINGRLEARHSGTTNLTVKYTDEKTGIELTKTVEARVLPDPVSLEISAEDSFTSGDKPSETRITATLSFDDGTAQVLNATEYKLEVSNPLVAHVIREEEEYLLSFPARPSDAQRIEACWLEGTYTDRIRDNNGRIVFEKEYKDSKTVKNRVAVEKEVEPLTEPTVKVVPGRRKVKRVKSIKK